MASCELVWEALRFVYPRVQEREREQAHWVICGAREHVISREEAINATVTIMPTRKLSISLLSLHCTHCIIFAFIRHLWTSALQAFRCELRFYSFFFFFFLLMQFAFACTSFPRATCAFFFLHNRSSIEFCAFFSIHVPFICPFKSLI